EYSGVFLAIMADLWSGWRKAKATGAKRTSKALRNTVDKVARYYNALIALTVLDAMVMGAAIYLERFQGWNIPAFPAFSLIGALGLTLIEIKSICENTGKRKEMEHVSKMVSEILKRTDSHEVMHTIIDALEHRDNE
ncbi:MAG: phage holin family protein, partial [Muribaculaceae bacterium]|nr:phage holin family protein [Muribaculaceae bacterium]